MKSFLSAAACIFTLISCNDAGSSGEDSNNAASVPMISYNISGSYPHDTASFTQGLEFYNGQLLESTGNKGKSKLQQLNLQTTKPVRHIDLDNQHFGEGITVLRDTVYQLTWQEHVVHVYTAKDFKKVKEFKINTDGWGLTNDGTNLIATDGSSNLYFYDPSTFKLLRVQSVTENGAPVVNLNELEFVNGFVYANQWQLNYILKIDPNSGQVISKLDLTDLVNRVKARYPQADVLNGIAFNKENQRFYVTGKYWPEIYEIQFAL
ncbi:MAG TPA: glutaminyl-peptide cyclotransferase [Chitinophagaceae bacterium]|nr:glutaminyl-peptide cyclotransferase [Chitinophagaceae bacterium]